MDTQEPCAVQEKLRTLSEELLLNGRRGRFIVGLAALFPHDGRFDLYHGWLYDKPNRPRHIVGIISHVYRYDGIVWAEGRFFNTYSLPYRVYWEGPEGEAEA